MRNTAILIAATVLAAGLAACKPASDPSGSAADPEQSGQCRWYVSDGTENFHHLGSIFLGREITEPVEQISIENY